MPVMNDAPAGVVAKAFAKVPEATALFWLVKVAATTLGETGGDAVSMSMNLGYLEASGIFFVCFFASVFWQIKAARFHPFLYWTAVVATTTLGTTLADFLDRSLGIGYAGGSVVLIACVLGSLYAWRRKLGSVAIGTVATPAAETFYWLTIMFSQTLGTALGDWTSSLPAVGYARSAFLFSAMLGVLALLHFFKKANGTLLFWAAFVLTRPLGASVGDFLDKPLAAGGLNLSRYAASAALAVFIALCITLFKQSAAKRAH